MSYDNNGNMLTVSGTLFGSNTLVYDDENRLNQITYGGVTDLRWQEASSCPTRWQGQRMRARLAGGYRNYVYNGERVLEEWLDSGTVQVRYTTESGSYYAPWLHTRRSGAHSFPPHGRRASPLYDNIGSARGLVDASGTVTDNYVLDTFGRYVSGSGTTVNPYKYGAAWGYITDPSGMLQLGARFCWPEVGRFLQQDVSEEEPNAYVYAQDNPVELADPEGEVSEAWETTKCLFSWNCAWKDTFKENKPYYKCWAKGFIWDQVPIPRSLGSAAKHGAKHGASRGLAMTWYHFTDRRFTKWGLHSKKLVPKLAGSIALCGGIYVDALSNMVKCAPYAR